MDSTGTRMATSERMGGGLLSVLRGLALTGQALIEALLAVWVSLCVTLLCLGVGVVLVPGALEGARAQARRQRRLARRWSGVRVDEHYLPSAHRGAGIAASWRRVHQMLGDPMTWRDLRWLVVNPLVGPFMAFPPALAIIHGLWGLCLPLLWQDVVRSWEHSWFAFVPLVSQTTAVLAAVVGAVEIALGVLLARTLIRLHGRWVQVMLGRASRAALTSRMEHLAHSRSDTVVAQAAELRRIERDLHDGAQARLVAMGMTLSAAEDLLERNPAAARALLAEARNSSAKALRELRDLVRGVHPPVLADRGLVDAVRALALETPIPVEVTSSLPARPLPQIESAAYFAICELLNNAAKYADAKQVTIDLRHSEGMLQATVHDDGVGGVDPHKGTGIRGVERRLLPFDGFVSITSPVGGPTEVTIHVPCELATVAGPAPH